MASCNNCFNGCTETVSDQCIKYTGNDIPALGIHSGDSLASVEASIINFLVPMLNGAGIRPLIDPSIICTTVHQYLPRCTECTGFTLNEVLSALINATCDLQGQINVINATLTALESTYNVSCLNNVTDISGTHNILQEVINTLCSLQTDLAAVILDLSTNYVNIADINQYIQTYLNSLPGVNLISNKMVPYCPIPYIGTLSNFDLTGAGIGVWNKIYLCNGNNATPDYRGRTLVGATTMGSNPFSPVVDPSILGNPTYVLNSTFGANQVSLTNANQLPPHTHPNTVTVTDPGHKHKFNKTNDYTAGGSEATSGFGINGTEDTSTESTGITVAVTVGSTGSSLPHPNIQPVQAAYYIVYIP